MKIKIKSINAICLSRSKMISFSLFVGHLANI